MKSVKDEYKIYLQTIAGTEIYRSFKEILYSKNDSLVSYFNNEILKDILPEQKQIKICDIGSGDAKRLISIGSFIKSLHKNESLFLDMIEQSSEFCNQARNNLSKENPFNDFNIINQLFENQALESDYDLIFLIHSIFAFKDSTSINKVFDGLSNDGKVVLFSNAEDSFLANLKESIDNNFIDSRLEINTVEELLVKNKIGFDKFQFNTEWSISYQDFEAKINILLEWLSLGHFKNFSSAQKNAIYSLIIDLARSENEYYHFTEKEVILVIPATEIKKNDSIILEKHCNIL